MLRAFLISDREAGLILPYIPLEIKSKGNLYIGCIDEDGICCGASVLRLDQKSLRLIYIYMAREYRQCGGAAAMVDLAHRIGLRSGACGIEVGFFSDNDTRNIIRFLEAVGFEEDTEIGELETETVLEELDKSLSVYAKKKSSKARLISLKDLPAREFNRMQDRLRKGREEEDLFTLLPMVSYEKELSFFAYRGEEPAGGIVVRKLEKDLLEVSYVWTFKDSSRDLFMELLYCSMDAARMDYPWTTRVRIIGKNENSISIIDKLSGQKRTSRVPKRYLYGF